jgi:hypothetical protein
MRFGGDGTMTIVMDAIDLAILSSGVATAARLSRFSCATGNDAGEPVQYPGAVLSARIGIDLPAAVGAIR